MSTQPPVVWLASYPKSGNTWLRFMLYAALYGTPKRSADVPAKIQDIHRKMPTDLEGISPHFIKTHFELTDQHPLLDRTHKAIHILRNPRDILLSGLNYRKLADKKNWSPQDTNKNYARSFMQTKGAPDWLNTGFGNWGSHARSWYNTDRFQVLKLRYEELKADPKAGLVTMLDFLELDRTEDQINQAIKDSSFDAMRALEIREKNADKSNDLTKRLFIGTPESSRKGHFFVNKGLTNQSLEHIAPGLDAMFNEALKEDLAEFGYSQESNS